jgi:hypothetical protein
MTNSSVVTFAVIASFSFGLFVNFFEQKKAEKDAENFANFVSAISYLMTTRR